MKLWIFIGLAFLSSLGLFALTIERSGDHDDVNVVRLDSSSIAGDRVPVIVELFTSEGCSSCPPADAVLTKLEQTQPVAEAEIIALGEHVDYWNYIGWSDPFSSGVFSDRQGEYVRAFNRDGAYTPQMVVDGKIEFIGSKLNRAIEAIAEAARAPKAKVQIVSTAESPASSLRFQIRATGLPAISPNDRVEIALAITESDLKSSVTRGENAGRRLGHSSVVRQINIVGNTQVKDDLSLTAEAVVTLAKDWNHEKLRAVAFVQEHNSRRIIGAASKFLAHLK